MDIFVEQIVQVKKGAREWAIIIGVILAGVAVLTVVAHIALFIFPFLAAGVGWVAWYVLTAQSREFEYSITNGTIDVDLIVAKRRRKRVVSVSGSKIERFVPYSQEIAAERFDRQVYAWTSSEDLTTAWMFTYRSQKSGHTLVVFTPNEKVLNAARSGLSPLVRRAGEK